MANKRIVIPALLTAAWLAVPGLLCVAPVPAAAEDPLHVLPAHDIDRLRLDFNASRNKVRIVLVLSPT